MRTIDPLSNRRIEVRTRLVFDNWLLRNYYPGVVNCTTDVKIEALRGALTLSSKCDVFTHFSDGIKTADLVAQTETPKIVNRWEHFQLAAQAHGYVPCLRTTQIIRSNMVLLCNLDRMHQVLVSCPNSFTNETVRRFHSQFKRSGTTELLFADFSNPKHGLRNVADVLLYRMYVLDLIDLNLAEVPFGPRSSIRLK